MDKNKLLYETIVEDLKIKILNSQFKSNQKLPTEYELAEQYGVSRITSKRALEELKLQGLIYRIRGSGSFVSPINPVKTMESPAQASSNGRNIVAIMLPWHVTESSFAQSVRGAVEVLDKNGCYISVYNGIKDIKEEQKLIRKLYEDQIKGIIYYPISDRDNYEILNTLYLEDYPIVMIDKYFEGLPISNVISDNELGAAIATQYLIDLGHVNIAFVSDLSIESTTSIRNRYFGYCKTLKKNNLKVSQEFVRTGFSDEHHRTYKSESYKEIVRSLLARKVTAVFAVNDLNATFLMRAAFEMGIKVPADLSIIGFDDIEMAQHLQVPLTTISQDFVEIGRTAAQILVDGILEGKFEAKQCKLPVKLVVRESCAVMNRK